MEKSKDPKWLLIFLSLWRKEVATPEGKILKRDSP